MCGIAGKLHHSPDRSIAAREIESMLIPMNHRGPDGRGVYLDGNVGLGHLRLSIIDLAGGSQPMANEDESVWIVFNGEIYNFQPLRDELLRRGHVFKTKSDTEVIVHLYEEHGPECVRRLQGMFAFAIWDKREQRLFVARDRVGIKPLYYSEHGGTISFASEIKGVLADPEVPREVHAPALAKFFTFFFTAGDDTLLKSVKKLPPGHYLIAQDGAVRIQQYWDLKFTRERWNLSFDDAVSEFKELFQATVRDHMIADVPVGILLSGGVDSSAVLSFAAASSSRRLSAFTIGFEGQQVVDERPFARQVAQRYGAEHFELSITAEDFWNFLPDYMHYMEEPVHEPPAIALYYISRLARQHVKVLLSGEGGDEAFAGYPNYPDMLRFDRIGKRLGPLARLAGIAARVTGRLTGLRNPQRYGAALGRPLAEHYYSRNSGPTTFFNECQERFFDAGFIAASGEGVVPFMREVLRPAQSATLLEQMLYTDTKTWLPDDLLVKADKMTMANSIELRVPLLDHVLLEFAASLPPEHKVRGTETKRVLKTAFRSVLPQEILDRPKAGFPVPYAGWLRHELRSRVEEVLLGSVALRSYVQKGALERLLTESRRGKDFSREIFCLLAVEFWHEKFMRPANHLPTSSSPAAVYS